MLKPISSARACAGLQERTKQSVRLLLALGTPASCSHSRARVLVAQSSLPTANSTCNIAFSRTGQEHNAFLVTTLPCALNSVC